MAELKIPEPSEKQCLFMADRHKYIGYGGARGGGKSWAVRVKAVLLCLRYAGIKVMIIRKTYPELQENHIIPLCEMLGCYADESERIASYNDGKKHIVFPNGSRILFRYCDNDKDVSVELPVLQRGSTGETVRAMQILLRGRGFGVGWYGADGEFGAATEEGLRAFQRVKTEETDGVCGERTWSRLLKG